AFWITVGAGLVFTLLGIALSGPIAALYEQPAAQPLLAALSTSFLITAIGSTQITLLLRGMDFRRAELIGLIGALAGGALGVATAAAGAGAWAIIGQQLATAVACSAIAWQQSSWRPSRVFSRASLRDLGGFSANMLGQRLAWYGQVNGDNFLVGRFLGTAMLG